MNDIDIADIKGKVNSWVHYDPKEFAKEMMKIDWTKIITSSRMISSYFPKIEIPVKKPEEPSDTNDIWEKIREYNVYVVGSTALAKFFPFIKPHDFDVAVEGITTEELLLKIRDIKSGCTLSDFDEIEYTYMGGLKIVDSKISDEGMDIWGVPQIKYYIDGVGFNFLEIAVNLKTQMVVSSKKFNNFLLNKEMSCNLSKIEKYSTDKMVKRIKLFEENGFHCDDVLSKWVNSKV